MPEDDKCPSAGELRQYTVPELRGKARDLGLTGYSKKSKDSLLEMIGASCGIAPQDGEGEKQGKAKEVEWYPPRSRYPQYPPGGHLGM